MGVCVWAQGAEPVMTHNRRDPPLPSNWTDATVPIICPFCSEQRQLDQGDYPTIHCICCSRSWTLVPVTGVDRREYPR